MIARLIGLTGNIGSGKSTVARLLAQKPHVTHLETDCIWKQALDLLPVRKRLAELYGADIIRDGHVDVPVFAERFFREPRNRAELERRLEVERMARERISGEVSRTRNRASPQELIVCESATLIESGLHQQMSSVVLVTCAPEEQMRRALAREMESGRRLSREEIKQRLSRQWEPARARPFAHHVIDTTCSLLELESRVEELYKMLKREQWRSK